MYTYKLKINTEKTEFKVKLINSNTSDNVYIESKIHLVVVGELIFRSIISDLFFIGTLY